MRFQKLADNQIFVSDMPNVTGAVVSGVSLDGQESNTQLPWLLEGVLRTKNSNLHFLAETWKLYVLALRTLGIPPGHTKLPWPQEDPPDSTRTQLWSYLGGPPKPSGFIIHWSECRTCACGRTHTHSYRGKNGVINCWKCKISSFGIERCTR